MLNITYKDRRTNIWVKERTTMMDIISKCEKNEVVPGRAHQRPQSRPINHTCRYLETIQKTMTRETSQSVERRPGQILGRHDLAEDRARQVKLEATC